MSALQGRRRILDGIARISHQHAALGAIPLESEFIEYLVRILTLAEAAVIAAEGAFQISLFHVEVILQNRAAKSQIGVDV